MTSHIVSCPSCQCAMKVAQRAAPGKKIRCPKCQSVFASPTFLEHTDAPLPPSLHETTSNLKESPAEVTIGLPESKKEASTVGDQSGLDLAFLAPPEKPDELGRLDTFRILKVLGHGGMGAVLLAEDPKLKRQVAIKVMLPQLAKSKQARERFLREAQAAAALEHDYIVPILHVGEDRDVPYIVMPFLRGESLDARLKGPEPLSMSAILQIAAQATEALVVAHDAGFIHRDIKPANIWLEQREIVTSDRVTGDKKIASSDLALSGSSLVTRHSSLSTSFRLKLLDFGLARLAVHDDQHLTQSGAMLGTPGFIAPEQAEGHDVDGRVDVFSLGCVLYRLVTGQAAFPGNTMIARLQSLLVANPAPPLRLNSKTPPALSDLIERMLSKNRDLRPTASEVLGVLQSMPPLTPAATAISVTDVIAPQPPPADPTQFRTVPTLAVPRPQSASPVGQVASLPTANLPPTPPRSGPTNLLAQRGQAASLPHKSRRAVWLVLALVLFAPLAWYAATVVVRLETENGTLLVEIHDDAVEARIKNGKLILTGPDGQARYTLAPHERNKLLAAGPYKIRVDGADGLSLDTEEFTLKKGDTVTVRVTMEAKKPDDPPPATFKNSIGMEFVKVGKGTGWLGGGGGKIGDIKVEFLDDFYLGKYEVTQEEWEKVTGLTPSHWSRTGGGKQAVKDVNSTELRAFPVENVSWEDTQVFLEQLNKLEIASGWVYRLPKRAEWEYACRGGPLSNKLNGEFDFYLEKPTNELLPGQANFANALGRTCRVGSYKPNCLGVYDMHGNVHEWCDDAVNANNSNLLRARTGGCWDDGASYCRTTFIDLDPTTRRSSVLGLRVVRVRVQPPDPTYTNSTGMEFVRVPKGKFFLGGGGGKVGDKEVEIADDFYLGKYEVTQEEWEKVTGQMPGSFSRNGKGKAAVNEIEDDDLKRFPVHNVTWDDCQLFLASLNKGDKQSGWTYRLPTEREWEYACRGGPSADPLKSAFDYYLAKPSNQLSAEQANFKHDDGPKRPSKVGSYPPNPLRLFDMHGNVWEWCRDELPVDPNDPTKGTSLRAYRGGSWFVDQKSCRAASRVTFPPSYRSHNLGLRVARVPVARP